MERGQRGCRGRAGWAAAEPAWPAFPGLNLPLWPPPRTRAAVEGGAEGWAMPGVPPAPPPGCRDTGGGAAGAEDSMCRERGRRRLAPRGLQGHPSCGDTGRSSPWAGDGWNQAAGTSGQRAAGTLAGQHAGLQAPWAPGVAAHLQTLTLLPTHTHAEPELPLAPAGMVSGPPAERRGLPATHALVGPRDRKALFGAKCPVPAAGSNLEPGQTWPCQG